MDKIVKCEKCGAMVKVLIDCTCDNCGIKCCEETMKEISEEEAVEIQDYISNKYPSCDVELQPGGQPIYYYIISAE